MTEYELTDILEDVVLGTVRDVLAENVRYVLEREGQLPSKGASVTVSPIGLDFTPRGPGMTTARVHAWWVCWKSPDEMHASGEVHGWLDDVPEQGVVTQLLEISVEVVE